MSGEHMEVLKADSTEPIKGLYAIGNTAGDFYCGIDYTMDPGLSRPCAYPGLRHGQIRREPLSEGRTARIYDILSAERFSLPRFSRS